LLPHILNHKRYCCFLYTANAKIKRNSSMRDTLRSKLSMKSLNVVKQMNKRTKTKKGRKKKFSKNFKGKVIDGVHELYTMTMGMMLGLRVSVRLFVFHVNVIVTYMYFTIDCYLLLTHNIIILYYTGKSLSQ